MKTLEDLIKDKPPEVQKAIRDAILLVRERPSYYEYQSNIRDSIHRVTYASDARLSFAIFLLAEVISLVEYLHKQKVEKSRREGTAAGLAAYEESLRAGPGKKDEK